MAWSQGKGEWILQGRLVQHQVAVGGTAVFVAQVTPILEGLWARGEEIMKR